jgi:fructose-bisphosphate aldolase class II
VFHGSSRSNERELADAISFGAVKANVDTDNEYAFTRAIAGHVLDHWQGVLKVDGGWGTASTPERGAGPGRRR